MLRLEKDANLEQFSKEGIRGCLWCIQGDSDRNASLWVMKKLLTGKRTNTANQSLNVW